MTYRSVSLHVLSGKQVQDVARHKLFLNMCSLSAWPVNLICCSYTVDAIGFAGHTLTQVA